MVPVREWWLTGAKMTRGERTGETCCTTSDVERQQELRWMQLDCFSRIDLDWYLRAPRASA